MKKLTILIAILFFNCVLCFAQNVEPAPQDKAVVYFVRSSSLGFAINFTYFDSASVIGRFNGPKYIRYECEPGKHLFWVKAENRDFVEADVDAGKIYFIEAVPNMGGIKAGVKLVPVDPADQKKMSKIWKFLEKKDSESFTADELAQETKNFETAISKGLEKYKDEKEKGKTTARLERTMSYTK